MIHDIHRNHLLNVFILNCLYLCFYIVRPYMIQAPKDTIAMAGSSVQLQCKIGGTPQPEVFWKKISNSGVAQHIRTTNYR